MASTERPDLAGNASPSFGVYVRAVLRAMQPRRFQKALAKSLDVDDGHFARMLDGNANLPLAYVPKIAAFLERPELEVYARATGRDDTADLLAGDESLRRFIREETERSFRTLVGEDVAAAGREVRLRGVPEEVLVSRTLPIYGYPGAAQKLADVRVNPEELRREVPPAEFAPEIGPQGYGVVIEGDSLEGLGVRDGDLAWVNPEDQRLAQPGDVVLARIHRADVDEPKVVIKQLVEDREGRRLCSAPEGAGEGYRMEDVAKLTRVICIVPQQPRAFRPGRAR